VGRGQRCSAVASRKTVLAAGLASAEQRQKRLRAKDEGKDINVEGQGDSKNRRAAAAVDKLDGAPICFTSVNLTLRCAAGLTVHLRGTKNRSKKRKRKGREVRE
jgi:alpha-L-arabinofuranosidase